MQSRCVKSIAALLLLVTGLVVVWQPYTEQRFTPSPSDPNSPHETGLGMSIRKVAVACEALDFLFPLAPRGDRQMEDLMQDRQSSHRWTPKSGQPRFYPAEETLLLDLYHSDKNPYLSAGLPPDVVEVPPFYSGAATEKKAIHAKIKELLGGLPKLMLEVGSFLGDGARTTWGPLLAEAGGFVICIDTWAGDLNMKLGKWFQDWMKLEHGLPTVATLFMQTMKRASLHETVFPLQLTSFLGCRLIYLLGYNVDLVYVDSAHEAGETVVELSLYYKLLRPGGVLMGDDITWPAVARDVHLFAACHGLHVDVFAPNEWVIQKPDN